MADKLQQGIFDSFTVVNNGLIETELLTVDEKMVYIVIRKHLNQEKQVAFPGMATISREARISKPRVIKAINGLEEKKLLIVKRQTTKYNVRKTNIYRFNDFAELWKAKTVDELKEIADDEIIHKAMQISKNKRQKLYNQLAKEFKKEKELESEPVKAQNQALKLNNIDIKKDIINTNKSQAERYGLADIKSLFDYNVLISAYPDQRNDWDTVLDILHETLNTTKSTIKIGGEDKPYSVVIGKLLKLTYYDIEYAVTKFHNQTAKITNTRAYLLTILYHAREQSYLELMNLGHRNGDF